MIVISDKLSTESFHAFIDEQLDEEQYVQVEEQLDEIPEKVEEIQQCQMINERLREVFDPIVEEEIPQDLFELALYGVISEREEESQDYQQYAYEYDDDLNAIVGDENDIVSPMDSMDSALELQDEDFINDDEFSDLEALSGQEGLADFDIDAISKDNNQIIPDIFDSAGEQSQQNSKFIQPQTASSQDDEAMLESIESLSLEPLGAEDTPATEASSAPVLSEPTAEHVESASPNESYAGIDVPDLELEPLTQSEETSAQTGFVDSSENVDVEAQQAEPLSDQEIAKEKVLESLEASEDLSLESLQAEQDADAIQMPADSGKTEAPDSNVAPADEETVAQATTEQEVAPEIHSRHFLGGNDLEEPSVGKNTVAESSAIEAQKEFSVELTNAVDAEPGHGPVQTPVNEPEAIEASSAETIAEPVDDTPVTISKQIDQLVDGMDDMSSASNGDPDDVVAEFFAENKAEPDFEVSEVVKQFEEVSGEFNQHHHQDSLDSPVTQMKQRADDVLNVINNKIFSLKQSILKKDEDAIPDFNQAPVFQTPVAPPSENSAEFVEESYDVDAGQVNEPVSPFDFDVGVDDDQTKAEESKRKVGDTLKSYKQKLSQQKLAEAEDGAVEPGKDVVLHQEATGFSKYTRIAVDAIEKVSPENRMTIGGFILLVIGLVIGGSTAALFGVVPGVASNDKIEQLAIDAHILYTQQDQNFAGNPSTSITESMQWLSARIGRHIRLADVQLEDFKHQRAIIMPTMVSYATANIFENTSKEKITLFIAANMDAVGNSPMTCRIPTGVDGLCAWVKDSVSYVAVSNLSLTRVREFSRAIIEKL
jgi:hypothetical protein